MADQQLTVFEPADLTIETWLDEGRELIKEEKELKGEARKFGRTHDILQWKIGDWMIEGEDDGVKKKRFKDKAFKRKAVEITKRPWGSLKNLMSVARHVPESRRRDGREGRKFLPYSLHVEVAKFDAEKQEELLQLAEESRCSV